MTSGPDPSLPVKLPRQDTGERSGLRRQSRSWRWPVRSAGVNFALAYGGIFLLSAALFLSFTWWSTTSQLDRHVQEAVENDAGDLIRRWEFGGPSALVRAIDERLEQNVDDDALYLLVNPKALRLAGNLPGWPVIMAKMDHFYELTIRRYQFSTQAKLKAWQLSGGYRLIVGHDVRGRGLLRHMITQTVIWCSLMVTLLALGGAIAVRRLFRHIVHSVARTTSAVAQGDLSQRIELNGSETDLVARTVNTMLDRINRLMEGVRQVSNAIAHDLRTPIARARARLEDAALHARTEEALQDAISQAILDLDHITSIFEALLRIAQIETGARRAAFAQIDLSVTLQNMTEFYCALAEDAGIELILETSALPGFFGDSHLLQQALANMLDNAIKFTDQGGMIILRGQFHPLAGSEDHIPAASGTDSGSAQRGMIELSVCDQGPGMDEGDIARAHERFFRADAARNTPGSGLGLSLVQAVAHLHHGSLILENRHPGLRSSLLLPVGDTDNNPGPKNEIREEKAEDKEKQRSA